MLVTTVTGTAVVGEPVVVKELTTLQAVGYEADRTGLGEWPMMAAVLTPQGFSADAAPEAHVPSDISTPAER